MSGIGHTAAGSSGPQTRRLKRFPLLRVYPALTKELPPSERAQAEAALMVPIISVPRGAWAAPQTAPPGAQTGFLVVAGQLTRRVEIGQGCSVELIGEGDLLRPWQEDASAYCVASWQVLGAARLAVLDTGYVRAAASWPQLQLELLDRALRRSRFMAAAAAVSNSVGVEQRLLTLFWQVSEKWGRVEDGVVIVTIKLTHQLIGDLVGARRPTVTQALRTLISEGAIERLSDGCWALHRSPS